MTETTGSIINIVNTGQTITLTVTITNKENPDISASTKFDVTVLPLTEEEAVLKPAKQLLLFKSKRKVPVLGTLRVGQEVAVYYDEKHPSAAYLKDNIK